MTPPHIEPEWYFLPTFYAILRAIPDMLGGVVAMGLSVVIFMILPFADRTTIPGGARHRPVYRAMFYVFIADVLLLGYIGSQPPAGVLIPIGQAATLIYFSTFLFAALHLQVGRSVGCGHAACRLSWLLCLGKAHPIKSRRKGVQHETLICIRVMLDGHSVHVLGKRSPAKEN